jgi:hypothetical protein
MKTATWIFILLFCFLNGLLFFAFQKEWIIIRSPFSVSSTVSYSIDEHTEHKKITLFYWHQDTWKTENTEIIWRKNMSHDLNALINAWFIIARQERYIKNIIHIQAVFITPSGQDGYLSCDQTFFDSQSSTYEKWMLIESLLKTIRNNGIILQNIYILSHFQPLQDHHLDFSRPWPLQGFTHV